MTCTLILTVDHALSLSMGGLSEHLPLVPFLHFDLIQDHPRTLDIMYAFEPQWAVLGRETQDIISFVAKRILPGCK